MFGDLSGGRQEIHSTNLGRPRVSAGKGPLSQGTSLRRRVVPRQCYYSPNGDTETQNDSLWTSSGLISTAQQRKNGDIPRQHSIVHMMPSQAAIIKFPSIIVNHSLPPTYPAHDRSRYLDSVSCTCHPCLKPRFPRDAAKSSVDEHTKKAQNMKTGTTR